MNTLLYSPKVAAILQKGTDMKLSEFQYLLKREVELSDIAQYIGCTQDELLQMRRNLQGPRKRKKYDCQLDKLTVDIYHNLKSQGLADVQIAERYKTSEAKLRSWRIAKGIIEMNMKGLTKEKYIVERLAGLKDYQIVKKYRLSTWILYGWRRRHFTDEDLKKLKKVKA